MNLQRQKWLLLLLWLIAAAVGAAPAAKDSVKSPTGAMLRSLAVPGWGQWYNGKKFKAVLAAGGELGLVVDAIWLNQLAVRSSNEYDRLYYQDNRSLAIWWLAGVILYSMADAYVDAHLFKFDESPALSMQPASSGPNRPSAYMGISVSVNF
jgi:hypothetical protein